MRRRRVKQRVAIFKIDRPDFPIARLYAKLNRLVKEFPFQKIERRRYYDGTLGEQKAIADWSFRQYLKLDKRLPDKIKDQLTKLKQLSDAGELVEYDFIDGRDKLKAKAPELLRKLKIKPETLLKETEAFQRSVWQHAMRSQITNYIIQKHPRDKELDLKIHIAERGNHKLYWALDKLKTTLQLACEPAKK